MVNILVSTIVQCGAAQRVVMVTLCIRLSLSHGSTFRHHSPSSSILDGFNLTNMVVVTDFIQTRGSHNDVIQFETLFMCTVFKNTINFLTNKQLKVRTLTTCDIWSRYCIAWSFGKTNVSTLNKKVYHKDTSTLPRTYQYCNSNNNGALILYILLFT